MNNYQWNKKNKFEYMNMSNRNVLFSALAALMLCISTGIHAYPLLTFNAITGSGDNGLIYDVTTKELSIIGTLTGSYDVTAPSSFANSSVVLTATFNSAIDDTTTGYTFADFINGGTLSIFDGDGTTNLLEGSLENLLMYGATRGDQATMIGDFQIAGGFLMSEFQSVADLFALELNFNTPFDASIFQELGFSADVYGTVSSDAVSVSEPSILLLFVTGMAMLGFVSSRKVNN